MTLSFVRASDAWVAQIGAIHIFVTDHDGEADASQAGVAQEIAESLPTLELAASEYLDLFVDRAKACGDGEEPWWLEEVEFRTPPCGGVPTYNINFTLSGDDGGLWSVRMNVSDSGHRPVGLERRQG